MASILGVETLQHTNGTTAATIDSSGNVDMPQLATSKAIAFTAKKSSVEAPSSGSMYTGWTVVVDTHSGYQSSTGKYRAPVAGLYAVSCAMLSNAQSGHVSWSFYKNGTQYHRGGYINGGYGHQQSSNETIIELDVNDEVSIGADANASDTTVYGEANGMTNFTVKYLGKA